MKTNRANRNTLKNLPEPNNQAKTLSDKLSQRIAQQLKRHGDMRFSQFMEMALYTPELGYYSGTLPKIGRDGDFITAPEVSPIFSRCIARQAAQVLSQLEQPNIIEFGAGQGTMAKDILLELDALDQTIERYYIVELSADLRERQKQTLSAQLSAELMAKITWLNQLPKTPIPLSTQ